MSLEKKAKTYAQTLMQELKEMYDGKYKNPMQLPASEKKKFFDHMDKVWKGKKEAAQESEWLSGKVMEVKNVNYGDYDKEFWVMSDKGDFIGVLDSKKYDNDIKKKDNVKFKLYRNLYTALVSEIRKDTKEASLEEKVNELVKEKLAKKKESHVLQLEKIDKKNVQKYFKHYLKDFDIKDIDIAYHIDRFDLGMWAHGKDYMYGIEASYPLFDKGQVSLEIYKREGKDKKKVKTKVYDKFEEAVEEIKNYENKQ